MKKRRNNSILEKFYDAKIVDVRDGLVKKRLKLGMQQDEPPRIEGLRQKRSCISRAVQKTWTCRIRRLRYEIFAIS